MSLKTDSFKYTPRKEQKDALDYIKKIKSESPDSKFFLLDLPTGIGKSQLAINIAHWYSTKIDKNAKFDIITATKILQDQYENEYESINSLKGKENYRCNTYQCSCAQGKEFNRLNKTSCDSCPYDTARESFYGGKIALTNFYLYLIYAVYNKNFIQQRGSKVLIVDECHEVENQISNFISIRITENIIKKLKFSNSKNIIKKLKAVKNIENYVDFLLQLTSEIEDTINQLENSMTVDRDPQRDKRDLKINNIIGGENKDIKLMSVVNDLKSYELKIEVFLKEYKDNPNNWVLENNYNEKSKQRELSLEPIWAFDYLDKYVWSHYDMIILMSGTILNKGIFCDLNGIDPKKAVYYSVKSPFDVKNRKIYYMPIGKMSWNKKELTFKKFIPYISKILKKYEKVKGIIHTNSFELSSWIESEIKDSRFIFHDSDNKDEMLKKHFESLDPTVIVSPSMSLGVSFDHERARFQIIAKIPYPSLASQKNKIRQKNNPEWYSYKTICDLIQSCGRITRSMTDYGDTIIIDESFGDVLRFSSHLIPKWLQIAIKKVDIKN